MNRNAEPPFSVVIHLVRGIYTQPAWLMAFFLFLVCLIAFADERSQFTSDPRHLFDPFGFSLLNPSTSPFNAHSMLSIAGFFMIPSTMIYWHNTRLPSMPSLLSDFNLRNLLPLAGFLMYCLFLIISLPLMAISPAYRNPPALIVTFLDLLFLAGITAWLTSIILVIVKQPKFKGIFVWMIVGAFHLARCMIDPILIPPEAREIVVSAWSMVVWHFILMIVFLTIHLLIAPSARMAGSTRTARST